MHITIRACFPCFFYNPYMSLFNSKNFSFTCLHSFFTCLYVYYSSANQELTYGETVGLYKLCIQYTNAMCAPFCTHPNYGTDSSPQNVLTCNNALGQEASYTVLINLGLAELRSVRDSIAPRSYVDTRSQAFSDSRA